MHPNWPLRWPDGWHDAAALDLLEDTLIGFLLVPAAQGYADVIARARQLGVTVCEADQLPAGVAMIKGEWPGIRMTPGQGDASSGPTGAPWIDSNGWLVRLIGAQRPRSTVWVTADPPKSNEIIPLARHLVAVADGAAHGGRWVVTLDHDLAQGLAAGKGASVDGWRKLMRAIAFFEAHAEWNEWRADAVLAVVSSFAAADEFFSHEVLNLLARTNVSYAIVDKSRTMPEALRGLHAVLYMDAEPPAAVQRQALLDFVERGGLLITAPQFGRLPGAPMPGSSHPRYELRRFGKGTIAIAHAPPSDPYEVAQDAQILVSHRYDLLRFFNGFLLGGYATVSPDGKRKLVHIINYGGEVGDDPPSARIAGHFRSARLWSLGTSAPLRLEMVAQRSGVEVHLPLLEVYVGVELETEHA